MWRCLVVLLRPLQLEDGWELLDLRSGSDIVGFQPERRNGFAAPRELGACLGFGLGVVLPLNDPELLEDTVYAGASIDFFDGGSIPFVTL